MISISRRQCMAGAGALAAAPFLGAQARPLDLPTGLQLYSVGGDLSEDFEGTLRRVAAIGYTEVELANFAGRSASALRDAFAAAGLACRSAHYGVSELETNLDKAIAEAKIIGLTTMVCAFPRFADQIDITLDE